MKQKLTFIFFASVLIAIPKGIIAQTNVDSCVANWSGVQFSIPVPFINMLNATSLDTFYVAPNEPNASDTLNGQYPTFIGGNNGPWKSFQGITNLSQMGDSISPGDVLMLREGTYDIDTTLSVSFMGTESNPVIVTNYPNENPILNGTFDSAWYYTVTHPPDSVLINYYSTWNNVPMVRITGKYLIVDGITFKNSHLTCVSLHNNSYVIIQNCTFYGSLEDGIKTTVSSKNVLLRNNDFTYFGGEAIDVFASQNYYIIDNDFHDAFNETNPRSTVTAAWAKGGADSIYFVNNQFRDLHVANQALALGGCCWNNWGDPYDSLGNVKPVSTHVFAYGNRFINVILDSTYKYNGVLSFQASEFTEAKNNLFFKCDQVMSISPADQDTISLVAKNLRFENNTIIMQNGGKLYSIISGYDTATTFIDSNCVYSDGNIVCLLGSSWGDIMTYANFKSNFGFDINGCTGAYDEACDSLLVSSVNHEISMNRQVKIYPNPFNDYAILEFENLNNRVHSISIYSLAGQVVERITNISTGQVKIKKKNLKARLYFFVLTSDAELVGTGKFVIE